MSRTIKAVTFDLWDTVVHDDSDEPKRKAKGLRTNGPQAGALSQDVQSPRSQDTQSPRGQQPAQRQQATQLVNEAAAACDAGNPTVASQKGPRGDGPTSPIDGAEVPWC